MSFSSVLDASGSTVMNKSKANWTTTLGLVVHAAADGIALGKIEEEKLSFSI